MSVRPAALLLAVLAACSGGVYLPDGGPDGGPDAGDAGDAGPSCDPLQLETSGQFDIDLHAVSVSGTVTLDGAPAPGGDPRGSISFATDAGVVLAAVSDAGTAAYSTRLFAGRYDVGFTKAADCRAAALPCGAQTLREDQPLLTSGALDLDVKSPPAPITVSGSVTVNGAQPAAGTRGRIEFVSGATTVAANLPAAGAATFSVQLAPGSWDVRVVETPDCTQTFPLPCQAYVWKRAQALLTSGSLAIDLPVVQLSGTVTVNGAPMANATASRGSVSLLDADGNGPAVAFGATGAATYSAKLYAGARQIAVLPPSPCTPGPLPCARRLVGTVQVPVSGAYDFDLPVVTVSGHVTANGAAPASVVHGATRGALIFAPWGDKEPADAVKADLGASGPATYTALLYAGLYEASISNATDCPDGAFPCGKRLISPGVSLTVSGALDLDAAIARVTLTVTANGAGLPNSPTGAGRGVVTFSNATDVAVSLPPSGAASAAVTVYKGTHGVAVANTSDCPKGPLPCQTWSDPVARSIQTDGALTLDLPVLDVIGLVTANGQTVATSGTGKSRGSLRFLLTGQPPVEAALPASGDARYAVRLFPGQYEVDFANTTDCPDGALPCQPAVKVLDLALNNAGVFDVDLPVREISGKVTLDGAALPTRPGSRGTLRLGGRAIDLGSTGPFSYRLKLLRGAYDVSVENRADCGPLPCGAVSICR